MNKFCMYCKTYSGDFDRFKILLESFNKFNKENINLYVSVTEAEIEQFLQFQSDTVKVISDESYAKPYLATQTRYGFSVGYVNQEICKLCFWEAGFCENYLCLDSDSFFIRDFYISDFMANENTPYSVLVMDKDLSTEKYYKDWWDGRQKEIRKIYGYVGLNDKRYRTCHNTQVFSIKVLQSLKNDFMKSKNLDYKDLIEISPFEFTWYNVWLQKSEMIDIIAVEPFFKMFHVRIEYILHRIKMITKDDLARAYVGVILNSNWEKHPPVDYENPTYLHKKFYKWLLKH